MDVLPGEALLEEVRWTAGHVACLRERVQEIEQRIDPDGQVGDDQDGVACVARGVLAGAASPGGRCKAALRAGIEERQVRGGCRGGGRRGRCCVGACDAAADAA